jgi:anti-sigma factor RsiW
MSERPPHKLAELTAYVYGRDTPEQRADFEAHLQTCAECQADLERARRLMPYANELLQKPPDTSVDGMMRLMERAEREIKTERAERRARKAHRRPWILAGATLAAAAAAALLLLYSLSNPSHIYAAPPRPGIDGGLAGAKRPG